MEDRASEALGEPVEAVMIVTGKGGGKAELLRSVARHAPGGGVTDDMAADHAADRPRGGLPSGGFLYAALTPTRLVFFRQKPGILKARLGEPIGELERSAITGFELGDGGTLTKPLRVGLAGGEGLDLEVPRAQVRKARALGEALGV